jgi:hypothetical protein
MVEFEHIYWDWASLIRAILVRTSHPNKLPLAHLWIKCIRRSAREASLVGQLRYILVPYR